jgi:hypothetical protein
VHWAFSPRRVAGAKLPMCWNVQNLRIIATWRRSLKMQLDFHHPVSFLPAKVVSIFSLTSERSELRSRSSARNDWRRTSRESRDNL